ncbi:unnamed protein product, partial [Symbiodinium sp. CCMP2456]
PPRGSAVANCGALPCPHGAVLCASRSGCPRCCQHGGTAAVRADVWPRDSQQPAKSGKRLSREALLAPGPGTLAGAEVCAGDLRLGSRAWLLQLFGLHRSSHRADDRAQGAGQAAQRGQGASLVAGGEAASARRSGPPVGDARRSRPHLLPWHHPALLGRAARRRGLCQAAAGAARLAACGYAARSAAAGAGRPPAPPRRRVPLERGAASAGGG